MAARHRAVERMMEGGKPRRSRFFCFALDPMPVSRRKINRKSLLGRLS
jgi:hypothetical protein